MTDKLTQLALRNSLSARYNPSLVLYWSSLELLHNNNELTQLNFIWISVQIQVNRIENWC